MIKNVVLNWLNNNLLTAMVIIFVLSLVSLVLSIMALARFKASQQENQEIVKPSFLGRLRLDRYEPLHLLILACLTAYVLINWNKCISMQLFDDFNGDNILFVVWITALFLLIYRVRIKDVEIFKRVFELEKEYSYEDLKYKIQQRENLSEQMKALNNQKEMEKSLKEAGSNGSEN